MITSCKLPSKSGEVADIALGFDSIDGKHFLMIKINCNCVRPEQWGKEMIY